MCEERFQESFFCHVLRLTANKRCLKENGVLVLPFHPRVIAGLTEHVGWNQVNTGNVKDLEDIDTNWMHTVEQQRHWCKNGFDNKLNAGEFESELKKQGNKMRLTEADHEVDRSGHQQPC